MVDCIESYFLSSVKAQLFMKNVILFVAIILPVIGLVIGYLLDGTILGMLYGAGSGLLLGGVVRRLPRLVQKPETDDESPPKSEPPVEEV